MERSSEERMRQHVMQQFMQLGYTIIDGSQEEHGLCAATGRQDINQVVLLPRLRAALETLNEERPGQPIAAGLVDKAIDELTRNRGLLSLARANQEVYNLLRDGIKIDARGEIVVAQAEDAEPDPVPEQTTRHKRASARRRLGSPPVQKRVDEPYRTLHVIDWREPDNLDHNDFTLVSHLWVNGKQGKRCLDLVAFVNGLPFVLLESMRGVETELRHTYDRIDQDYKENLPALFWYNAFIIVASTFTGKMGSLTTPWEHFAQWKRVKDEREDENTKLATLIEGVCDKTRLLDLVENFTLFDVSGGLSKLIARNHQYLGVNNAIASLRRWEQERQAGGPELRERHGKLGVFWHTQGSGKSYSMVFFVRKVQRTIGSQYTFLVVTDRDDLDEQIYKNFRYCEAIYEDADEVRASNAKELKRLLTERHLILFTLIQKFRSDAPGQDYEEISNNENIIVLADEAHRTQYDTLAKNMRIALPRASFLGFTGTPLIRGQEEETRTTFGDYVSIYNFRRAINDGTTVPLYYENHTPPVDIPDEEGFQAEMAELFEKATLDERQQQKVVEQYAHSQNIFFKGERLDLVAADIVKHFMNRGYMGKAMVVSMDKITAVRTYNRVQEQWKLQEEVLRAQIEQESDPDSRVELAHKLAYMEETDMAVVVSASDGPEGDVKRFADFSKETGELVEIASHHQRFKTQELAEDFKKAEHRLRVAFVCGMWMTGFDVACLSTMYLDRPLKGHTLMQTIARANRVYEDKNNGLIVDYGSNVRSLAEAMAVYAQEDSGGTSEDDRPIGDKSELVQKLRESLTEAGQFCQQQGIDVQVLLTKLTGERDRQQQKMLVRDAVNSLLVNDEIKLRALLLTSLVDKLYNAILPDAAEPEFTLPVHLYRLIKTGIYTIMHVTGFEPTARQAKHIVHEALQVQEVEERLDPNTLIPRGSFDLRDLDVKALQNDLRGSHRYIKAEELRQLLYNRIRRMLEVNPSRVKYIERLRRIVDRYNAGSADFAGEPPMVDPQEKIRPYPAARDERKLDEYDDELVGLSVDLEQERQRSEREGLNEEELTVFDLLTQDVELSEEEHAQVRQIAQQLLASLRPTFGVIDWQKKPMTLNRVSARIDEQLSKLPMPPYNEDLLAEKQEDLNLYVQERYRNDGSSVA